MALVGLIKPDLSPVVIPVVSNPSRVRLARRVVSPFFVLSPLLILAKAVMLPDLRINAGLALSLLGGLGINSVTLLQSEQQNI